MYRKIVLLKERQKRAPASLFHIFELIYSIQFARSDIRLLFTLQPRSICVPFVSRDIGEVKAEHRFLHSWRDKSSVFLSPSCLQRGVKAKATQNTVLSFLPSTVIENTDLRKGGRSGVKVSEQSSNVLFFFFPFRVIRAVFHSRRLSNSTVIVATIPVPIYREIYIYIYDAI